MTHHLDGQGHEALRDATPRISVITVVYNGAQEIRRTIESVLAQDVPGLEYIVVDGASTDGTAAIVRSFGQAINRLVSEPDRGVYDAMNKGLSLARGTWLLFMNCGDRFCGPQALSMLLAGADARGGEQMLFGGWIREGDPDGDRPCRPDLQRGAFNHQALAYSRSIHAWHGHYAVVPGFSAADYLFFGTLLDSPRVCGRVVDTEVARIDVNGLSAGLQTFSQKHAIDFLRGRISRHRMALLLLLHPIYHRLKRLLK